MKLNQITSMLTMFAGVNIFYALFTMTQRQILNTIVFLSTFLCLIYTAAILEEKVQESYEEKLMEEMLEEVK